MNHGRAKVEEKTEFEPAFYKCWHPVVEESLITLIIVLFLRIKLTNSGNLEEIWGAHIPFLLE